VKDFREYFKGKKITMLGLGLLGRGLNDARFLAKCGADLIITDLKAEEQLKTSLKKLAKYNSIKYVLGGHQVEDFQGRDFILKAAGVPIHSVYLEEAQKNNIPIKMDASWFTELSPETVVVGVTGTRGKSTVTHLIYHILKLSGRRVFLGGNVRGLATLPLLKKVKPWDVVVLELDSWQLQGFGDSKISPHVSVFTNLMSDHLNYYMKGSQNEKEAEERYFRDKTQIYLHQKADDYLICGEKIARRIGQIKGKKIIARKEAVPKAWKIKIPGGHNLENIACAVRACEALGIPLNIIKKGVESYMGIPGRLELVREYKGVKIYNDTNATTPDATLVALQALGPNKLKSYKLQPNIILILGGADKCLDMSGLIKEIPKYTKEVFLLSGTGSEKLIANSSQLKVFKYNKCDNLKYAVGEAIKKAKKGDIILFSPAFASFGMFKNEYDRGDKFNKLIKGLK
jgi:UDP-N-acetylmuramoylalanine--D-glutamate ligase